MHIPNISLAYIVAELSPLIDGCIVRRVQELDNGWLKFKLQTRQGTKDLIAAPDALFLTFFSMPARQTTSGYGAFLRKRLSNKKIISFKQHGFDRIIVIELEGFFLIFELFAKGNIVLLDEKKIILSAFRKERWKDRILKKGEDYKFPSSKGISPAGLDSKSLENILKKSNSDLVRTLVKDINIAPSFAEEACLKASVGKEKQAKEITEKEIAKLVSAIKELYSVDLKKEAVSTAEKAGSEILLPFELNCLPKLESFNSLNEAIDLAYGKQFSEAKGADERNAVSKKKAELDYSIQQQKEALETFLSKIELNAKKAKLIYANYSRLFPLIQSLNSAKKEKNWEKEIMYKIKNEFPFLKSFNLKQGKVVVSLE